MTFAEGEVDENVSKAERAALQWLSLVDTGEFEESWREMSEYARSEMGEAEMAQKLRAARSPLGEVRSRDLKQAQSLSEISGAPDGEYVVLEFESGFSSGVSLKERVTLSRETDGQFRVAGY